MQSIPTGTIRGGSSASSAAYADDKDGDKGVSFRDTAITIDDGAARGSDGAADEGRLTTTSTSSWGLFSGRASQEQEQAEAAAPPPPPTPQGLSLIHI